MQEVGTAYTPLTSNSESPQSKVRAPCTRLQGALVAVIVLDFLTSEGRQDSELEQDMAKRLCDDLKKANLDLITKLMIVLFMKNFDYHFIS